MSKEFVTIGAMLLGLVLLAASFWWSASKEPPSSWTEEDATAFLDEGVKLHDMSFQVRRNGPTGKNAPKGVSPEELAAQKKRYEEKRSELESAQNYRYWTSWTMFGFGLVLTVGGLFVNKLAGS